MVRGNLLTERSGEGVLFKTTATILTRMITWECKYVQFLIKLYTYDLCNLLHVHYTWKKALLIFFFFFDVKRSKLPLTTLGHIRFLGEHPGFLWVGGSLLRELLAC